MEFPPARVLPVSIGAASLQAGKGGAFWAGLHMMLSHIAPQGWEVGVQLVVILLDLLSIFSI